MTEKKRKKKKHIIEELENILEIDESDHPAHEKYVKEENIKE